MVSQAGSDQVMNTIKGFAGNGMIGYVEYSYPINADYPVVKVENKAGYFVEPTQYNTAVALTKAKINQDKSSQLYLTQILDGVYSNADPRAYPISSYSYMIIPTGADDPRMSTAKRQTLADFMYYSLCAGQTKAGPYGYSPLPLNLVQAGFEQLAKLKKADAKVDLTDRDVRSCNNPTFDGKNLNQQRARRQGAAAGRVRQDRRRSVRHRHRHRTSPAPTRAATAAAAASTRRRRQRRSDGTGGHRPGTRPRRWRCAADSGRPRDRRGHDTGRPPPRPGDDGLRQPDRAGRQPHRRPEHLRLAGRPRAARAGAGARPVRRVDPSSPPADRTDAHEPPSRRWRSSLVALLAARGEHVPVPADASPRPTSTARPRADDAWSETKTVARTVVEADGTTHSYPFTDPFDVTVNVDHTQNLRGRERVEITWKGAQPSGGRASNPYGVNGLNQEYPVVILQCRGTGAEVTPETCWTSSYSQRSQVSSRELRGHVDPRR